MILRRLKAHVEKENWFAIFLDFAIVVFGVFIGVQLGNWNEARSERAALMTALSNLSLETQTNLGIIDQMVAKIDAAMVSVNEGRQVLQNCSTGEEASLALATGIAGLSADYDPTFVTSALHILSDREKFIGGLSPESRRAFYHYQSRLEEEQDQLKTNFNLAWNDHIVLHPLMDGDMSYDVKAAFGTQVDKPPIFVSSLEAACQSPTFRRRYQLTTGLIYVISLRLTNLRDEVEDFRSVLEDEMGQSK